MYTSDKTRQIKSNEYKCNNKHIQCHYNGNNKNLRYHLSTSISHKNLMPTKSIAGITTTTTARSENSANSKQYKRAINAITNLFLLIANAETLKVHKGG